MEAFYQDEKFEDSIGLGVLAGYYGRWKFGAQRGRLGRQIPQRSFALPVPWPAGTEARQKCRMRGAEYQRALQLDENAPFLTGEAQIRVSNKLKKKRNMIQIGKTTYEERIANKTWRFFVPEPTLESMRAS